MGTDAGRVDAEGAGARSRFVRWSLGAGAVATAVWLWLQLDLLDDRVFGNFYDIQARALLDGHLDVPAGSLGNEAFLVRGQEWLYNPPGPALLRLPVLLVTDRLDGRLTVASMLLAWVLTLVVTALLLWRVRGLLRPGAPLPRWEAAALAAFLLLVTLGSTLLYLGSVPWVFHEAYAWAVPMSIGAVWALLGVLHRPGTAGLLLTAGFTLGAILSRIPAGMACGIAVVGAAGWRLLQDRHDGSAAWRKWGLVAAAGVVPVLIGFAVNWAKFRHPWAFPIEDQVFTRVSASRREAIAANGGDLFGLDVLPAALSAYLRPGGIGFSGLFPFVGLPAEPALEHGAVLDLTYRTGSVVSFMPGLVVLSIWGAVVAVRDRKRWPGSPLWWLLASLALPPGFLFLVAYLTHRYTAEFVPLLAVAGAIGLVDLLGRAGRWGVDRRDLLLGGLGALALFGIVANVALAVQTQALANPGAVLSDHVAAQDRWSGLLGGDLHDHVRVSATLPDDGATGEVHVVGDCQAVYVGTGETFTPWVEAGVRPLGWRIAVVGPGAPGGSSPVALAEFTGHRRTLLVLERAGDGSFRVALRGGGRDDESPPVEVAVGSLFRVEVTTDDRADYRVLVGDDEVLTLPKEARDDEWSWLPTVLVPRPVAADVAATAGVQVDLEPGPAPAVCRHLDLDDR